MNASDIRRTEQLATKRLERSSYHYRVSLQNAGHRRMLVNLQNDRFHDHVWFYVETPKNPDPPQLAGKIAAKAPLAIDAQNRSILMRE